MFLLIVLVAIVVVALLAAVVFASPEKTGQIVVLRAEKAENPPVYGAGAPSWGPWATHKATCRCEVCR